MVIAGDGGHVDASEACDEVVRHTFIDELDDPSGTEALRGQPNLSRVCVMNDVMGRGGYSSNS